MENKQNTVDNAPREEITDPDLAVGLAEFGFHVYLDDTDKQLTFEKIYDYFDDYGRLKDGHTFTVPMTEVAQFGALEAICEKFESFNDEVRADGGLHADSGLPGLSLKDYANELLDDEESHFEWRNGQSEWENVRRGILSGETKFLHNFLYDAEFDYPSRAAGIREDLYDYEKTYLTIPQQQDISHKTAHKTANDDLSATRGENRGKAMEQITEVIPISELTPKFLAGFAQKTESFYQTVEQILDDVSECRIRYGVNDSNHTVVFGTLDSKELDDLIKKSNYDFIPGELRVLEGGDLGENLYKELGEQLSAEHITTLKSREHIPQQQDISHKSNNNAELSAARETFGHSNANGQKRSIIMSNNTKLGVSSMTISDDENSAIKAFASVTVNDEFAIKNIKVIESDKGLFVAMPSRKSGNEYSDVVFPITKEAREQLNNAVIECYNDMQSKGQDRFMADNTPPEKSVSTITASIHPQNYENSHVKGTGQIVIDDSFVVSGVKVVEGKDGQLFASMPSYTNDVDERKDFAFPITKECYEKVQNAVLDDYAYIQNYHEMGGKENLSTAYNLNAGFADKLSEELNKQGIENLVKKSDGRANITVKLEDKDRFAEIRKDFAQKLQNERDSSKKSLSQRIEKAKAQQPEKAAEQTPAKQPHKKPNSQEL